MPQKYKITLQLFALLFFALLSSASHARDYIVEAIVFSNEMANQQTASNQDLSSQRGRSMQNKFIARTVRARAINNPLGLSTLAGIRRSLEKSPEHQVLRSLSWVQSEANHARSPLVNVSAQHLQGAIRVYAPNLLFTQINLKYTPPNLSTQLSDVPASYFIDEQRKLKLKEIHYFDHPQFGVILSVKPK